MYTVTEEVRVFLEKEDILKIVNDAIDEDAVYFVGDELPVNYEGSFQKIKWTKDGEMVVTFR